MSFVRSGRFGGGAGGRKSAVAELREQIGEDGSILGDLDPRLLEAVMQRMAAGPLGGGEDPEWDEANDLLMRVKQAPGAWRHMHSVLEETNDTQTQMFALSVLEMTAKYGWHTLEVGERIGVREWIVGTVVEKVPDTVPPGGGVLSGSARDKVRAARQYVAKLNTVLVQILKQDWPDDWPEFVKDLLESAALAPALCANAFDILRLLSEDVFEFAQAELLSSKTQSLRSSMAAQLSPVLDLMAEVLGSDKEPQLVYLYKAALECLQRFLVWLPVESIFEGPLLRLLISEFLVEPDTATLALKCLTSVAELQCPPFDGAFAELFLAAMGPIEGMVPADPEDAMAMYAEAARDGRFEDETRMRQVTLFLTTFLRNHMGTVAPASAGMDGFPGGDAGVGEDMSHQLGEATVFALRLLVSLTACDDPEFLRIAVDFWRWFARELYRIQARAPRSERAAVEAETDHLALSASLGAGVRGSEALAPYEELLPTLRRILVARMARPEEFLLTVDDDGHVTREVTKDTAEVELFRRMREALVYLTHLDAPDMTSALLDDLRDAVEAEHWTSESLSKLCWSIGCISGTLRPVDETFFVVAVVKHLLRMVTGVTEKSKKAIIAGNIMYVVGQYPRFLRANWKFLGTVANKLFEFMEERHPGVQDMAVDTFLKIARACRRALAEGTMEGSGQPYALHMAEGIPPVVSLLEPYQTESLFEAAGFVCSAIAAPRERDGVVDAVLSLPFQGWNDIVDAGVRDANELIQPETTKEMSRIFRALARAAKPLGSCLAAALGRTYVDMLHVYGALGKELMATWEEDPRNLNHFRIRYIRTARRDFIRLMEVFLLRVCVPLRGSASAGPMDSVLDDFVPPLLDIVLDEYRSFPAPLREARCLQFFTTLLGAAGRWLGARSTEILNTAFDGTLPLITEDLSQHPEHRAAFFRLLQTANEGQFEALLGMAEEHRRHVVDAIVWAARHGAIDIASTGFDTLRSFVANVGNASPDVAAGFYADYLLPILRDMLVLVTDGLHGSTFPHQVLTLWDLTGVVARAGAPGLPLWESVRPGTPEARAALVWATAVSNRVDPAFEPVRDVVIGEEDLALPPKAMDAIANISAAVDIDQEHTCAFVADALCEFLVENFPALGVDESQRMARRLVTPREPVRGSVSNPEEEPGFEDFHALIRDFLIESLRWVDGGDEEDAPDARRAIAQAESTARDREDRQRQSHVPGMQFALETTTLGPAATMADQDQDGEEPASATAVFSDDAGLFGDIGDEDDF